MTKELHHLILEHMHTYGMTIPQAVAKLFGLKVEDAEQALRELYELKLVRSALLTPTTDYFRLESKAAEVLRVEKVDSKPLKATPKIACFAMLHFCCLQKKYRPKISDAVWKARFMPFYRSHTKFNYYTEGQKLGYVRIDSQALGVNSTQKTSADPFRVIESCWRDIEKRERWRDVTNKTWKKCEEFTALVESGHFVMSVVTAFEERAKQIRARMQQMREDNAHHPFNVNLVAAGVKLSGRRRRCYRRFKETGQEPRLPPPMDVHVIPDLFELMYPTGD